MLNLLTGFLNTKFLNKKTLTAVIAVGVIVLSYMFWNKLEEGIYNEGYNTAVKEYQLKLIEEQNKHTIELNDKLRQLRVQLLEQHQLEMDKAISEMNVDTKVETITEYIEKKIYVKEGCDTVPTELNGMFNNSIRSINGKG